MEILSKSVKETAEVARDFLDKLKPENQMATIIGLSGELGSGKTTFVQNLAHELGLTGVITSPTFVIEKIYRLTGQKFQKLVHIDAYRLENGSELSKLGFQELTRDPSNLILIEWAERVADILNGTRTIYFKFIDENTRQINIA
ncbi:tRNA (adenosine(37)-N6)-threonylcarbamoyltransferase complex ATPase subunit type 1 TsaE [Candidatus Nomurabacteria bacterium]|nr:tRNA (adenosine(37)-N6)-threonylcarbamoyltransferase complex ATPase subunit type 1 TsaE [Candidatus Nomurabacteria bacterium]